MSAPILNTLDNELACPRKVPLGFSLDHGQFRSKSFFIQTCINERASLHWSPRSSSCATRRARYSAVIFGRRVNLVARLLVNLGFCRTKFWYPVASGSIFPGGPVPTTSRHC